MFLATCTTCGSRSLHSNGSITGVATSGAGHLVRYRCYCGAEASLGPLAGPRPAPGREAAPPG